MKTFSIVSTLVLSAALATSPVQAASETKQAAKGAATFYSAAIIGGMAAGPVGFFLGAIGGAHLAEKDKEFIANQEQLAENEKAIANLESSLSNKQERIEKLEKSAANKLEFAVMFATGKDELNEIDQQRIKTLATYLKDNPQLSIRLDGHTDPRGTEEYNNLLSQERAKSVIRAFEDQGVNSQRIVWFAHGANLSTAYKGDLEAYALERKVDIEVYVDETNDLAALSQ